MDHAEHTCSFCYTRQPEAAMGRSEAAAWTCLDTAACSARADTAGIYSQSENELQVSAMESRQGAVSR